MSFLALGSNEIETYVQILFSVLVEQHLCIRSSRSRIFLLLQFQNSLSVEFTLFWPSPVRLLLPLFIILRSLSCHPPTHRRSRLPSQFLLGH